MLSEDLIERVKSANPIEDVVAEYQSLSKRGANLWGLCPFHSDRHPSMSVSPSRGIFKCFVCGEGGNALKYVQQVEGITFVEAVRMLAAKKNIEIPEDMEESPEEKKRRLEREKLVRDNEQRQNEYKRAGESAQSFSEYLEKRSISREAAKAFGLGWCSAGEFRNRITYPFYSQSGVVVGWTARTLDPNERAKYKNSAESVLFKKDSLLFGLRQASKDIQHEKCVYIVEGQNDVIRMWMCGFRNTVAGSGTAFGEKQVQLLRRYCDEAILMYDGDNAGQAATLKSMKLLLKGGFKVKVVTLPMNEDPDSWLLHVEQSKAEDTTLAMIVANRTKPWSEYLSSIYPTSEDPAEMSKHVEQIACMIACVPEDIYRKKLINNLAYSYHVESGDIRSIVNKNRVAEDDWKGDLYGIDDAEDLRKVYGNNLILTFSKDYFFQHVDEAPTILWVGGTNKNAVQKLRAWESIMVRKEELTGDSDDDQEPVTLQVVKSIHGDGLRVRVSIPDTDDDGAKIERISGFTEWYLSRRTDEMTDDMTSDERADIIRQCMRVIADSDATTREVNNAEFRKLLRLPAASYNKLLNEILGSKKDRREAERRRANLSDKIATINNLYDVPEYIKENDIWNKYYEQYGFFPLLSQPKEGEEPHPVAYVFKNDKGGGHMVVSDFYMEALLFVDPATDHSKRVIRLNHMYGGSQFVEWPSDAFVSLQDMKKRLFGAGAYNFNGTPQQWDKIRQVLSYNFIDCYEARVFGWQPEGFLMLPNAVYYPDKDGEWKLEYTDNLGVAEVNNIRLYSPASSSIRLGGRKEDNPYEQDEYAFYLEPQEKDRMEFTEWAGLMDRVFQVNENGKWAVIFAIACSFRDLIYSIVGSFTALCFAGPTGSGKTELAYGIRGLWMRRDAAVFNLNSGSDAAFFIVLEHFRNMPVIMEEYNDNGISQVKFQGLKSAVYDDKGRTKVKDIANKSLDTSKTNAAPILLGQDTPQQDDGSLSNRVIICEVHKKEEGFDKIDSELFEKLKRQADLGMGNILCDIIRQRPVFERHFKRYFNEEVSRMKEDVWDSATNKDGLERVIRSVAILSATSRLVGEQCDIRLPWEHKHFYEMAISKVLSQMENISTTSKLGNFFYSLNTQLSIGTVIAGREFKIDECTTNMLTYKSNKKEKSVEVGVGCKILYIAFESAYRAYAKDVTGKDALSKQTLTNYFRSHSAYIGSIDTTRFSWDALDADKRTMVKHKTSTSAYMFKYDILCEQLNGIDFERIVSAVDDNTETSAPTTPAEPVKNNEPEIDGIDPNKDPFA